MCQVNCINTRVQLTEVKNYDFFRNGNNRPKISLSTFFDRGFLYFQFFAIYLQENISFNFFAIFRQKQINFNFWSLQLQLVTCDCECCFCVSVWLCHTFYCFIFRLLEQIPTGSTPANYNGPSPCHCSQWYWCCHCWSCVWQPSFCIFLCVWGRFEIFFFYFFATVVENFFCDTVRTPFLYFFRVFEKGLKYFFVFFCHFSDKLFFVVFWPSWKSGPMLHPDGDDTDCIIPLPDLFL